MQPTTTVLESPPTTASPQKKKGCFFRGCLGCLGFGILVLVGLGFAAWYIYNYGKSTLMEWSVDRPLEMRTIDMDNTEIQAGLARWEVLEEALDDGSGSGSYIIDQDMIDARLVHGDDDEYIDIQLFSGYAGLMMNIPLEQIGLSPSPKYITLVSTGTFAVKEGRPSFVISDLRIADRDLPPKLKNEILERNFAPYLYREDDMREILEQVDTLYFSGDIVVVELRARSDD